MASEPFILLIHYTRLHTKPEGLDVSIPIPRVSFPFGPFVKNEKNPILRPQGDSWEAKDLFNPAAVVKDGKVYILYRAEDDAGAGEWNGTSRIGLSSAKTACTLNATQSRYLCQLRAMNYRVDAKKSSRNANWRHVLPDVHRV